MSSADIPLELLVGAQVRALRQALGMTIAELATAASLSTGMLSKIENGQTSPSLTTLQALASALNMPLPVSKLNVRNYMTRFQFMDFDPGTQSNASFRLFLAGGFAVYTCRLFVVRRWSAHSIALQ